MAVVAYQNFRPDRVVMGRIDHGADIITALEGFCLAHGVKAAWIQLLGAVSKASLSYYEQVGHRYVTREFAGEYEIVGGTGNIALKDNRPVAHLHLVLSDTDYGTVAGHLMPGTSAVFACEFALFVLEGDDWLQRGRDETTGLPLWS